MKIDHDVLLIIYGAINDKFRALLHPFFNTG